MKREICEKCKHYIQHYSLGTMSGVYQIDCGHCSHLKTNMNKRTCEYFEEENKEKEKTSFEMLREIYRLNHSANYILKRLKLIQSMIVDLNKKNKETKKHN